ncbi:MAG: VWA domain-containing protein, partial [Methylococcales bacterium]|nr:VWA domain-containing protein [Methylococcales bacterium]
VRALVLAHREQPQPNDNQPPPPSTQPKPHIETAQAQGDWGEMPTEHITSAPLRKLPIENNAFVAPQTSTPSRNAGQQTSQCSGPQPGEKTNVHWFKTLSSPSRQNQPLTLKYKGQKKHRSMLHLILLDTSASTIAHNALAKAKGLVAGISQQAYLAREHLAVFAFGNQRCEWLLPPQRAVKDCRSQLNIVPAGGGTPLRIALNKAQQWIKRYKQQTPGTPLHVYLLTDGRSTETVSDLLWQEQTTVIDIESRPVPLGKCKQLAQQLGAQYISIQQIPELTS